MHYTCCCLCYLCHKCTEEVGLVVNPSGTLPDKTGIGRVRLVVAMVTVQIALGVGEGVGAGGDAEVNEGQVSGALDGVRVVLPNSAPVNRGRNPIICKQSICKSLYNNKSKVNKDFNKDFQLGDRGSNISIFSLRYQTGCWKITSVYKKPVVYFVLKKFNFL